MVVVVIVSGGGIVEFVPSVKEDSGRYGGMTHGVGSGTTMSEAQNNRAAVLQLHAPSSCSRDLKIWTGCILTCATGISLPDF